MHRFETTTVELALAGSDKPEDKTRLAYFRGLVWLNSGDYIRKVWTNCSGVLLHLHKLLRSGFPTDAHDAGWDAMAIWVCIF